MKILSWVFLMVLFFPVRCHADNLLDTWKRLPEPANVQCKIGSSSCTAYILVPERFDERQAIVERDGDNLVLLLPMQGPILYTLRDWMTHEVVNARRVKVVRFYMFSGRTKRGRILLK